MDPQVFIDITIPQLHASTQAYKDKGWRFVNMCGATIDAGVELIYSFSQGEALENLRLNVGIDEEVPSISDIYFNSFVFENETHDLFGVGIKDIAIDFGGNFYTTSVPTPMNPASRAALDAAKSNTYGAANYGACPVPTTTEEA
ncbi:MAG: NADH-quinone oxidoreductase subunit C [Coriobacteriales bacterium]|jgi:hypothetical protein|nr:NADH-quinone oxidoreductase subunit C [Coriobacteriales bacterium]